MTDFRDQQVIDMYVSGKNLREIGDIIGKTSTTVHRILIMNRIPRRSSNSIEARKPKMNIYAFDEITQESAYWAGFLMADGCIHKNWIMLGLASKDIEHLKKFRDFVKSPNKIRPAGNKTGFAFQISNTYLANRLARLGVVVGKLNRTATAELETNRDFWRGAIDGDGSLFFTKNGGIKLSFVGSEILVSQFLSFSRTVRPDSGANVWKTGSIFQTAFGASDSIPIIRSLYDNASIYLDRKMEIAKSVMYMKYIPGNRWHPSRYISE